jgi:hypothetical protein
MVAEFTDLAEQANGSVILRYGNTAVLATAVMSGRTRDDIDYFPLTVDYEERFYAAGILAAPLYAPRGRPSEQAILSAASSTAPSARSSRSTSATKCRWLLPCSRSTKKTLTQLRSTQHRSRSQPRHPVGRPGCRGAHRQKRDRRLHHQPNLQRARSEALDILGVRQRRHH